MRGGGAAAAANEWAAERSGATALAPRLRRTRERGAQRRDDGAGVAPASRARRASAGAASQP